MKAKQNRCDVLLLSSKFEKKYKNEIYEGNNQFQYGFVSKEVIHFFLHSSMTDVWQKIALQIVIISIFRMRPWLLFYASEVKVKWTGITIKTIKIYFIGHQQERKQQTHTDSERENP